jgi:Putative auto-transporter adhesin, head GIN domain
VRVFAAGDADVHATEKLTASVTGSGDIRYAGSPKKVDRNVKGSGSIESL